MRRFPAILLFVLALAAAAMTGCGGDDDDALFGQPAKITLTRVPTNMSPGQVSSIALTVFDDRDRVLAGAPVTYASSNQNALQIANNGLVCAGKWDSLTTPVTCTAGETGVVEVTATAGGANQKFTVYVHKAVTRVDITAEASACRSQGETRQYTAKVFAGNEEITNQVGTVNFRSTAAAVVGFDSTGKATAVNPGIADVYAEVAGFVTTPEAANRFETCRVTKVNLKIKDSTETHISQAAGANKTVVVELFDSTGKQIFLNNTASLRYATLDPSVASFSGTAAPTDGKFPTTMEGTITGGKPGFTAVTAVCAARAQDNVAACNIGLPPVFSNVLTVRTTGTSTATVYVANPESDTIIPITGTTVGTAISIKSSNETTAHKPNSMMIAGNGSRLFLGTAEGMITVDTATAAVSAPVVSVTGKVIAVNQDGSRAVFADTATDRVFVWATTATSAEVRSYNIPDATAAVFSTDPERVYVVNGSAVYYIPPTGLAVASPLGATDVTTLANGAFAYFAAGGEVQARAVCNNAFSGAVGANGAQLIERANDGRRVIGAGTTAFHVVTTQSTFEGCPPAATHGVANLGYGATVTPLGLLVTPDSTRAFVVANTPTVYGYEINTPAQVNIQLAGGGNALSAGVTADAATLYVGSSDKKIHKIDAVAGTDTAQVDVSITPVFLAVRSQ